MNEILTLIALICQVHSSDSASNTNWTQQKCQKRVAECFKTHTPDPKSLFDCMGAGVPQ